MGARVTHVITTRARLVLVVSFVLVALAAALGSGAIAKLKGGGFDDPASESSRASVALTRDLKQQSANLILLITSPSGSTVDSSTVAAVGRGAVARLSAQPAVVVLSDYWDARRPRPPACGARIPAGSGDRACERR